MQELWILDAHRTIEDYEYLFGRDFMDEMQNMYKAVDACVSAASASLAHNHISLPNTRTACCAITLRDWLTTRAVMSEAVSEFTMRATFAIVTSDELVSMVGSLKEQITGLDELIQTRLKKLPDVAPDLVKKEDRARFFEAILDLRDHGSSFRDWMHDLLDEASKADLACYVVPRFVDEEGHFHRFIDGGKLTVTFSIQKEKKLAGNIKLPQVTYPSEDSSPSQLFDEMQKLESKGNISRLLERQTTC